MGVLKYGSVRYGGSGVDIANTFDVRGQRNVERPERETPREKAPEVSAVSRDEVLAEIGRAHV